MTAQAVERVSATLVPIEQRMDFLPFFFGPRLMIQGENAVYGWLSSVSSNYKGGYWNYYTLSNGGFYMAPRIGDKMHLIIPGNWYDGKMSADAAGIVATLFGLNILMHRLPDSDERDMLIDHYYRLRNFASSHPEADFIACAID
jgi:hypothetical protein